MSRYVAESITTDAGCFGHVGLFQLHTKLFYFIFITNPYICIGYSPGTRTVATEYNTRPSNCIYSGGSLSHGL